MAVPRSQRQVPPRRRHQRAGALRMAICALSLPPRRGSSPVVLGSLLRMPSGAQGPVQGRGRSKGVGCKAHHPIRDPSEAQAPMTTNQNRRPLVFLDVGLDRSSIPAEPPEQKSVKGPPLTRASGVDRATRRKERLSNALSGTCGRTTEWGADWASRQQPVARPQGPA